MDCEIYFLAKDDFETIATELCNFLKGKRDGYTIESKHLEIDLMENDEYDIEKCRNFPDGFLFFNFFLEIYFIDEENADMAINQIKKILFWLWSNDLPAVASCDFEEQLPEKGGYKSENTPWRGNNTHNLKDK